jgi:hypothetical protein
MALATLQSARPAFTPASLFDGTIRPRVQYMSSATTDDPRPQRAALTEVERQVLTRAAESRSDLLRAAGIGRRNGMSYIVFGVISLAASFPSDQAGLGLGAVLVALGLNARSWSRRLAAADLAAPSRLALGEVALLLAIIVYCVAKMTIMRTSGAELADLVGSTSLDIDIEDMVDSATNVVYPTVILIGFLYQGGLALYYRARRSAVRFYREDTPEWAREIVSIVGT